MIDAIKDVTKWLGRKQYCETDNDPMWLWMKKLCVIPEEDLFRLTQEELRKKYDKYSYEELVNQLQEFK